MTMSNNQLLENSTEQVKRIIDAALLSQEKAIFKGKTSTFFAGHRTGSAEKKKYNVVDEHGAVEEFERTVFDQTMDDIQSIETGTENWMDELETTPSSQRAKDVNLTIEKRLDALREWIADDEDDVAAFILSELNQTNLTPEWKRVVIYSAESVRFPDATRHAQVARLLLKHAEELRSSSSPDDRPVVMCAIRRAGSILPESEIGSLLPFLASGSLIDTRLITLQAINSIFLSTPPQQDTVSNPLADRAFSLAEKHWDLDVFKSGDISALAIDATIAVIVLGNCRAADLIEEAKKTKREWVLRTLRTRLNEVLSLWSDVGVTSTAVETLQQVISIF